MEPPKGDVVDGRSVLNVVGERVALGPLRRDLIAAYQRWNNDFATTRTLARSEPTTVEQETAAYDQVTKDERYALVTIYERATRRAIGIAYLADIDRLNRTAEYGIVISEPDCRGKGYGTETTKLMVDYAFTVLGLHSVILTVYEYNLAGLRAYEKGGLSAVQAAPAGAFHGR